MAGDKSLPTGNVGQFEAAIETNHLQQFIEAVHAVVDECRVHLCEGRLVIRAVDPANVAMVDEHEPTDEQLATHREYREAYEPITGISAPFKQRERTIEETVRARFGFSRRYGGATPEPNPEYDHLDPTALKGELENAREEVDQAEQQKDALGQEIAEEEAQGSTKSGRSCLGN